MGTFLQQKEIFIYFFISGTWRAPDGRTGNQIDHIIMEEKVSNRLKNVRVKRGATGSDHFLVVRRLREETLNTVKRSSKQQKTYEVDRL